jgi:O-antigen/teichoic acid export membrane protein
MTQATANHISTRLVLSRTAGVAATLALAQSATGAVFVISARHIGPREFGRYSVALSLLAIVVIAFDFGLSALTVRQVAAGRWTAVEARQLVAQKRRWILPPAVLLAGGCYLYLGSFGASLVIAVAFFALWEGLASSSLLRSVGKFMITNVSLLIGRTSSVAIVLLGTLFNAGGLGLLASIASGYAIEALLNIAALRRLGYRSQERHSGLRFWTSQRAASSFGFTSLSAVAQQLDTPLVAAGGGAVNAGLYAAAGRLLGPLGFMSTAFSSVAVPWLAGASTSRERLRWEERRAQRLAFVLCAGPVLVLIGGPLVLPAILGARFATSADALRILAFGSVFSTLNQAPAAMLQIRGYPRWVATSIASGLSLGLLATYLLARVGGAVDAAWGFTVSQVTILALLSIRLRVVRKHMPRHLRIGSTEPNGDAG